MSRTIEEIQNEMDVKQASITELNELNSPSQTAIYTLFKFIIAYCIYTSELLWDKFKINLETSIKNAPTGTPQWVQDKAFKFQYSPTTPQVVQLVDFVPQYNPVDESLRIISRCSCDTSGTVKVAKNEPPEPLSNSELTAFQSYLSDIGFVGIAYFPLSTLPDKIMIEAEIFYKGQFDSVIQQTVKDAINNYLATIPFNGVIRLSSIEDAIQKVEGVEDVVLINVALRQDVQSYPISTANYMVYDNKVQFRSKVIYAGYAITETTASHTIDDTLTFTINNAGE